MRHFAHTIGVPSRDMRRVANPFLSAVLCRRVCLRLAKLGDALIGTQNALLGGPTSAQPWGTLTVVLLSDLAEVTSGKLDELGIDVPPSLAAAAGTWTWMAFARWKTSAPLTGRSWDKTLGQVRGKGWAATALTLRGLIADFRADAADVTGACVGSIAENPARASQVERALRVVETDTAVAEESDLLLAISGCPGKDDLYRPAQRYSQDSPWSIVATGWRSHHHSPVIFEALCNYLDQVFPHVHDLAAISCTEHTPPHDPDECLHSWALRSAQAHRSSVVEEWLSRLDLALDSISSADQDPALNCTHLVAVPFWPPTSDGMEPVAYLSQFDVVAGPFERRREYYQTPSVVVLRVPEWTAAHVEHLHRPLKVVAIDNDEAVQAVQLARAESVAIVAGEFRRRRKPSQRVTECRAEMDARSDPYLTYRPYRRPLTPGAQPPPLYPGQQNPDTAWKPPLASGRHVDSRVANGMSLSP